MIGAASAEALRPLLERCAFPEWTSDPPVRAHRIAKLATELAGRALVATDASGVPRAVAQRRELGWDSEFFGFPCARLDLFDGGATRAERAELLARVDPSPATFSIAQVDVRAGAVAESLAAVGFVPIATAVTYAHGLGPGLAPPQRPVRSAHAGDLERLREIAEQDTENRFRRDPCFPGAVVDRFRRTWITNLLGGLADDVLVVLEAGAVAGFVTVEAHPWGRRCGVLKLIGVASELRGRGIGRDLVLAALAWFQRNTDVMHVSTQGGNAQARRIYERAGCTAVCEEQVYHRWSGPPPRFADPPGEQDATSAGR